METMTRQWIDGDSARTMTNKYNSIVEDVEVLKKTSVSVDEMITSEPAEENLQSENTNGFAVNVRVNGTKLIITI